MSSDSLEPAPDSRSALTRFIDAFFREQNIKWMLGVGMLILVGSSLMLVGSQWDRMAPVAQYLVFLGYAAGIYVASEFSLHWLGLKRTGAGLQMLTVMLLPIVFAGLPWIADASGSGFVKWLYNGAFLLILVATFTFAWFAAGRIFRYLLRASQPTIVAAYLILCAAGALVPAAADSAAGEAGLFGFPGWAGAAVVSLALWLVFAAGAIKVNRHVFHLVEEQRWPRVFGFFPILLLGTQFATLYVLKLAPQLPLQWSGLAAALVALPVLMAADAVARVFIQRSGGLVRPWPWSVLLPLAVGLALCVGGLILSATGMPNPHALVPTAALVAVAMGVTARRTGLQAFAWGMLACVTLAYNFSPAFFADLARQAIQQSAHAVHEPKLPYAFYGLTYLPLLAAFAAAYRPVERRMGELFAAPLRRFSIGIAGILLCLSWTHLFGWPIGHSKAVFPVGAAFSILFAVQAIVFRERRLLVPACVALCAASLGLPVFVKQVLMREVPRGFAFACAVGAAALLTWPGRFVDVWARRNLPRADGDAPDCGAVAEVDSIPGGEAHFGLNCETVGLAWMVIVVAASLVPGALPWGAPLSWAFGAVASAALVGHARRYSFPGVAEVAIAYPLLYLLAQGHAARIEAPALLSMGAVALAALWTVRHALAAVQSHVTRRFAEAAGHLSRVGMSIVLVLYALPCCVLHTVDPVTGVAWVAIVVAVIWSFDAARTLCSPAFGYLGCAGVIALASAALSDFGGIPWAWERLPIVWSAVAICGLPAAVALRRSSPSDRADGSRVLHRAIDRSSLVLTVVMACGTIPFLSGPMRVAGALAVAGLIAHFAVRRDEPLRQLAVVAAHWQLLALAVQVFVPGVWFAGTLLLAEVGAAALPLALLAASGALMVERLFCRIEPLAERLIVDAHLLLARIITGLLLCASLLLLPTGLTAFQTGCALATFALIVAELLMRACRAQNAELVWLAETVAAAGVIYFIAFGLIPLHRGLSVYGLLGGAGVLSIAAAAAQRSERTAVLAGPFDRTALVLPGMAVMAAVARHVLADPVWIGMNSLALLFAAGFYLWRGWERRRPWLVVLAAAILNVALALLWRELTWSDPQFFMIPLGLSILALVEVLRAHIPPRSIAPLRYLGAIVILVSPTFHIVEGSWLHIGTLMVAAVVVTLLAIGLRARPLMFTGTGFLAADVVAMVVRGTIDRPQLLWLVGIALGLTVIALAASCEKHREDVRQRLRLIAAELQQWE